MGRLARHARLRVFRGFGRRLEAETRAAGYCWLAFSAAPHMDRAWLEFRADVVYAYKSYVRPAARGRGIAAALRFYLPE